MEFSELKEREARASLVQREVAKIFDFGRRDCQSPSQKCCFAAFLTALPARAPFVRFADIFPDSGEIHPLHKGAFIALTEQLAKLKFEEETMRLGIVGGIGEIFQKFPSFTLAFFAQQVYYGNKYRWDHIYTWALPFPK